jgi:hypothetical protein
MEWRKPSPLIDEAELRLIEGEKRIGRNDAAKSLSPN